MSATTVVEPAAAAAAAPVPTRSTALGRRSRLAKPRVPVLGSASSLLALAVGLLLAYVFHELRRISATVAELHRLAGPKVSPPPARDVAFVPGAAAAAFMFGAGSPPPRSPPSARIEEDDDEEDDDGASEEGDDRLLEEARKEAQRARLERSEEEELPNTGDRAVSFEEDATKSSHAKQRKKKGRV